MKFTGYDVKGEHVSAKEVTNVLYRSKSVKHVFYDGNQIWPDNSLRAGRIIVDTTPIDTTMLGVYWLHAYSLCQTLSSAFQNMRVIIAGRHYNLYTTYANYPVANYLRGEISFDKVDSPLGTAVRAGDTLTLSLTIPAHNSPHYATPNHPGKYESVEAMALPWYPYTRLHVNVLKGQKRVCGGTTASLVSLPSGIERIRFFTHAGGHWRGLYGVWGTAEGAAYLRSSHHYTYNNQAQPLDRAARIWCQESQSYYNEMWLAFPAVTTEVKLKVLAVFL